MLNVFDRSAPEQPISDIKAIAINTIFILYPFAFAFIVNFDALFLSYVDCEYRQLLCCNSKQKSANACCNYCYLWFIHIYSLWCEFN